MKKIYLDYAGSTPVDQRVHEAMSVYFLDAYGNPGGLHSFGQEAMAAIDSSRAALGRILGVDTAGASRIIFTGSATEANNLALRGTIKAFRRRLPAEKEPKIITSVIEHESVLETCRDLEMEGVEVIYLPVNRDGRVDVQKLKNSLDERTILVSIMYVNNQMGAIQPISEIADIIGDFRTKTLNLKPKTSPYPLFHTDAVQAFQYLDCNVENLGVDYFTLSAQKIYGPKGIGALYVRDASRLAPIITGGLQQEFGKRAGTENVPGIVGLGRASEIVAEMREEEARRVAKIRNRFWQALAKNVPAAELNGPSVRQPADLLRRIPNNLSIYIPGHSGQDLIAELDMSGVAVSTGAACSVRRALPSYAIQALGYSDERAGQTIRISFGRYTTQDDVDEAVRRITMVVEK